MPEGATRIDDASYLAGDAFTLPIGDSGADWVAPSTAPVMPNGRQAVRVAFLAASCATVAFAITDPAPDDGWETSLREDSSRHPYEFESWPTALAPRCGNEQVSTYLQVAYRPFVQGGAIHMVASIKNVTDPPPTTIEVVPVFTNADASQPAVTMDGSIALEPIAGPEKPRSATTQELFTGPFVKATLPDGTAPTHWGFMVTGCGTVGPKPIVITARVGGAAPIAVGGCSEGSFSVEMSSLPLPADGTHLAVLIAGGTTKSLLRVSEFQWRGDRP